MTTPEKSPPRKKPISDLVFGSVLFVIFIIFMALWLHFNLPDDSNKAPDPATTSQPAQDSTVKH